MHFAIVARRTPLSLLVYVQFSNHTQLKTDQTHSNASPSAQAALQAAQALVGASGDTGGKETVRWGISVG